MSDVTAVIDYERSTKDNKVQATDRESGQPLWQVEVLDGDPAASKRARTVTVKFATTAQPVCPPNASGMPFTPVVFEELSVLAYVDRSGESGRIAWSFRASGMTADTGKGLDLRRAGRRHKSLRLLIPSYPTDPDSTQSTVGDRLRSPHGPANPRRCSMARRGRVGIVSFAHRLATAVTSHI